MLNTIKPNQTKPLALQEGNIVIEIHFKALLKKCQVMTISFGSRSIHSLSGEQRDTRGKCLTETKLVPSEIRSTCLQDIIILLYAYVTLSDILFRPVGVLAPETFKLFGFPIIRLSVFLMKDIRELLRAH